MMTTRALAATMLVLLLGTTPALGQQADSIAEQGQDQTAPQSTAPAKDNTKNSGSTATAPATSTPQDSPFDYESSEEISKDLSVSFPVDI
jgi:hypothetical protein